MPTDCRLGWDAKPLPEGAADTSQSRQLHQRVTVPYTVSGCKRTSHGEVGSHCALTWQSSGPWGLKQRPGMPGASLTAQPGESVHLS